MFHQLQKQMMQQSLKHHNLHEIKYPPTNFHPTPACQMQNFLTISDSTCNTHPDRLLIHGQIKALLPIYDHKNICSYTYRNVAQTPIEVSGARRMTRKHSHLSPVLLQRHQLASSSQKNQQQLNLYQSPRTC